MFVVLTYSSLHVLHRLFSTHANCTFYAWASLLVGDACWPVVRRWSVFVAHDAQWWLQVVETLDAPFLVLPQLHPRMTL